MSVLVGIDCLGGRIYPKVMQPRITRGLPVEGVMRGIVVVALEVDRLRMEGRRRREVERDGGSLANMNG